MDGVGLQRQSCPNDGMPQRPFASSSLCRCSAADDEDRNGLADKGTTRTFCGSHILDMLLQFGDLDEIKDLPLYAKYKAIDIIKALKEGQQQHRSARRRWGGSVLAMVWVPPAVPASAVPVLSTRALALPRLEVSGPCQLFVSAKCAPAPAQLQLQPQPQPQPQLVHRHQIRS